MESSSKSNSHLMTPTGALVALICFFMPWINGSCGTMSGAQIGGGLWLIPVISVLVLLVYFLGRGMGHAIMIILLDVIALITIAVYFTRVLPMIEEIAVQFGVYGTLVGLFLVLAGAIVTTVQSKEDEVRSKDLPPPKKFDATTALKKCPMCAEEIKVEAKICRYCSHSFTDGEVLRSLEEARLKFEGNRSLDDQSKSDWKGKSFDQRSETSITAPSSRVQGDVLSESRKKRCAQCGNSVADSYFATPDICFDCFRKMPREEKERLRPNLAKPKETTVPKNERWVWAIILIAGVFVVGTLVVSQEGIFGGSPGQESNSSTSSQQTPGPSNQVPTGRARTGVSLPTEESNFISAVEWARNKYASAPNELIASAVRTRRGELLRSALDGSLHISGWIGTLEAMTTGTDGNADISIDLDDTNSDHSIQVTCSSLGSAFGGPSTEIAQGTSLYSAVANLSEGQRVVFSGTFSASNGRDYVEEGSLTETGSMLDPEFIFKFKTLRPY